MNQRIAKLYDQALVLESNGDYVAGELDFVKFAELIVRECIDQCSYNAESNDEWDKGVRWATNQIKRHFGVEE